ncbi:hypothetical protein OPIT5_02710 [Opitutaceae bacterium TAV5]|nr:hypothetical protein OPIT5_02710 [Opitutaceae bacterium TAV5]
MHDTLIGALKARRLYLRVRWEVRLRALPPSSALAEPDALVHLMDWTLEQFFQELQTGPRHSARESGQPRCPCGLNPLIAYFVTGEAALMEIMLDPRGRWAHLEPGRCTEEITIAREAIRRVAGREIDAFCAVCQRKEAPKTTLPSSFLRG